MSRNLCKSYCNECSTEIDVDDCTSIPMRFKDYAKLIGRKFSEDYYRDYFNLIIAQVKCPKCGELYAMWLNRDNLGKYDRDLSYWLTFNDEK